MSQPATIAAVAGAGGAATSAAAAPGPAPANVRTCSGWTAGSPSSPVLASPAAAFITGATLAVDGGMSGH